MNEIYVIGTIDFSDCYDEAERINKILSEERIGRDVVLSGKLGECSVQVYPSEGNSPHLHVESKEINKKICVRLDKAEFFRHGDKNDGVFNNRTEMKKFNKYMRSPNKAYKELTNYEVAVNMWNEKNPDYKINMDDLDMPDYTTIRDNK